MLCVLSKIFALSSVRLRCFPTLLIVGVICGIGVTAASFLMCSILCSFLRIEVRVVSRKLLCGFHATEVSGITIAPAELPALPPTSTSVTTPNRLPWFNIRRKPERNRSG